MAKLATIGHYKTISTSPTYKAYRQEAPLGYRTLPEDGDLTSCSSSGVIDAYQYTIQNNGADFSTATYASDKTYSSLAPDLRNSNDTLNGYQTIPANYVEYTNSPTLEKKYQINSTIEKRYLQQDNALDRTYQTIPYDHCPSGPPPPLPPLDGFRGHGKEPDYKARLDNSMTYKFYGGVEEISYTPGSAACYIIITGKSFLWTILTLLATLMVVVAIITPNWLVGKPKWIGLRSEKMNMSTFDHKERTFNPTIGIFNRCTKIHKFGDTHSDNCATYVTGFDMPSSEFPDLWKSSLIFFALASVLLGVTVITAVFSLCIRSICKKSIFTVSGLIQSIAGLFLIVGMVLYPAGWGADRIRTLCGDHAGPFAMADCSMGWAFFTCIGGTALVMGCALLSIHAEVATSSDKVESEVLEGKSFICLP